MNGFNQISLMGHIGREPLTTFTDEGKKMVKFPLAYSENVTKHGETTRETEWFNITAFNCHADLIESHCQSGDFIFIQGKLRSRQYDMNGIKVRHYEVLVHQVQLLERREKPIEGCEE